jgi:SOS-response transcriptional repressor LexA
VARALLPLRRVVVVGASMVPTLRSGDVVLVRLGAPIRPGDVVLASFRTLPHRWIVKRAVRVAEGGWLVASDNPFAGGDSSVHGIADVHGRAVVLLRWGWWPRSLPGDLGGDPSGMSNQRDYSP